MRVARGVTVASTKSGRPSSLTAVAFIVAVPVLIFAYLLFQPQAPAPSANVRTITVFRYEKPRNVTWQHPATMNQIIAKVRQVHGDDGIARLFTLEGRHIKKPSALPDQLIALDSTEHFYWPFIGEGHVHDVSRLQLDRDVRFISRYNSPRVFEIENFLSHEECDEIVRIGINKGLEASPLILADHEKGFDWSQARTSQGVFVEHWARPLLQRIAQRASNLTRIPSHYSEHMQIIHYNKQQHYWAHYDWIEPSVPVQSWPVRMAGGVDNRYLTILFYLNDVPKGGWTTFPMTNPGWSADTVGFNAAVCEETYECLKISPKKGNAVLFYDVLADGQKTGEKDTMSLHAGCDPVDSEKWAANFWVHLAPMRRPEEEISVCVGDECHPH